MSVKDNKTRAFVVILFAFACSAVFGFQWPVEDLAVTATFGENRWNHFHGGIDIGGGEQEIRPIDDGEVIFYFEEDLPYAPIPTGLGNFIVLEHAGGIRSLYAHLKPGTVESEEHIIEKSNVIGIVGESGSSLGKHLHFEVSDKEFRQLVNPLRLLPELPDGNAPSIGKVILLEQDQPVNPADLADPGEELTVRAGRWQVVLEVFDVSEYVDYFCPMAPYQVQIYLNGQKTLSVVLDALGEVDNRLGLEGGLSFNSYYLDTWLVNAGVVSIPEGSAQMEVIANDYVGNESIKRISITAVRR